jgi:hypothetical protein
MPALAALAFAAMALWPAGLLAHGTVWEEKPDDPAIVLRFSYTDGTIMPYAEVSVFAPGETEVPYQKGRTDKNGYFVIRPDSPGDWGFKVDDGQGHLAQGEVPYAPPAQAPSAAGPGGAPATEGAAKPEPRPPVRSGGSSVKAESVALGLSLILNLFLGLTLWRGRKKAAGGAK